VDSRRLGIRVGFLIHDVSRLRRALFDMRSPHLDVTRSEAWVLTGISRREEGLSQTELARVLGLGKVATGEFVADLERKGLVVRRLHLTDRRAYRVQTTPQGVKMLTKISAVVSKMNADIFADFSPADLARFEHELKGIKLKLKALVDPEADGAGQDPGRNGERTKRVVGTQRPAASVWPKKTAGG
jgi:MarR family transcriptional regulator, transcriptional regulator for hemolysin